MAKRKTLLPKADNPWVVLDELVVGKVTVVPGVIVKLRGKGPGKQGHNARVMEIRRRTDDTVEVVVYGGRGFPANAAGRLRFLTVTADRIERVVEVELRK